MSVTVGMQKEPEITVTMGMQNEVEITCGLPWRCRGRLTSRVGHLGNAEED